MCRCIIDLTVVMNIALVIRNAQTVENVVASDLERAVNELQAVREPAAWLAEPMLQLCACLMFAGLLSVPLRSRIIDL